MSQPPTVDFCKVLEELKWENLKSTFSWRRFFQTLLLVCTFSFLDVFTDFRYASSVDEDVCVFNNLSSPCGGLHYFQVQNCTYMFISLPAIMLIVASLQLKFAAFTDFLVCTIMAKKPRCCKEGLLRAAAGVMSFLFNLFMILSVISVCLVGLIWPELHEEYHIEDIAFGIAIACTIPLLGAKFLALFAHGPEMRKLVVRTTSSECQFESALQLWLLAWIFQSTGEYKGLIWLSSGLSSILLIGKSGAESSLTFSEQLSFDEVPFKKKLCLLLWFAPVYILSALFRIITLALITDRDLLYAWTALALGLPITVLFMLKLAGLESLEDLTPGHILLGVLGELTSITLWGEKTREGSKNFCLAMASFILLLNTVFLSIIYNDPLKGLGPWYQQPDNSSMSPAVWPRNDQVINAKKLPSYVCRLQLYGVLACDMLSICGTLLT